MLAADPVDFCHLPKAKAFSRIEAPDALHQALPPQDFVATGDAAVEIIGDIEKRAVAVGNARIERQQVGRQTVLAARGTAHFELLYCSRCPHRPMPQQPSLNMD